MIHDVSASASVVSLFEHFPSPATTQALRERDVIIAAVDRLQVRDDLNRFCKRYLIPLIDIGLEILPGGNARTAVSAYWAALDEPAGALAGGGQAADEGDRPGSPARRAA